MLTQEGIQKVVVVFIKSVCYKQKQMSLECTINHCGAPHGHRHREVPHPRLCVCDFFSILSENFNMSWAPAKRCFRRKPWQHWGPRNRKSVSRMCKIALFMMKRKEERKSPQKGLKSRFCRGRSREWVSSKMGLSLSCTQSANRAQKSIRGTKRRHEHRSNCSEVSATSS